MSASKVRRYEKLTDQELVDKFYQIPILKLVTNIIVFVAFLATFIVFGASSQIGLFFIMLAVSAVLAIVSRSLFSNEAREAVAKEMAIRYKGDPSKPYRCFFERELALTGSIKAKREGKVIVILSAVFGILNYLFGVLSALIAILFSAIPLVLGAFLWLCYIVFVACRANGLALACISASKYTVLPLKFSFGFLKIALIPNIRFTSFGDAIPELPQADPKSTLEEQLRIDPYLSFNGYVLPAGCRWDGTPRVSAAASAVFVEGTIVCDKNCHHSESDLNNSIRRAKEELEQHFRAQIETFLREHPNAATAKLTVEISGRLV